MNPVVQSSPVVWLVSVILLALIVIVIFRMMWRVAEPNEALIISGLHHKRQPEFGESLGFKIVTGTGTFVLPGVQVVRKLSLDLSESELSVECVTRQGIPVKLKAVVIYKVGDDYASIANAARRFLDQQDKMDVRITNVFAGHLRAIIGSLTIEEIIRERDKLTEATRSASGTEMEKLGLVVDSLQIQEVDDPTGYIANLARPHAAAVMKEARIAQAEADREATQTEQASEALKAAAVRESKIKQSGFQADIDQASAQAKLAGPLAEAIARQNVVVEETKIAELEAAKKEQELLVTVRRPADANAYETTTVATARRDADIAAAQAKARQVELSAEADAKRVRLSAAAQAESVRAIGDAEASAIQAKGLAQGEAIKARGLAEADAIEARAAALAQNQEAVIGQQLAERWPEIVEAAAKAIGGIDQMIVLNGAQGVSELLAQTLSQGATGLALARKLIGQNFNPNGAPPVQTNGVTPVARDSA